MQGTLSLEWVTLAFFPPLLSLSLDGSVVPFLQTGEENGRVVPLGGTVAVYKFHH